MLRSNFLELFSFYPSCLFLSLFKFKISLYFNLNTNHLIQKGFLSQQDGST